MAGLNKVILIGNLGQDVEMKYTASGMAIASFSLATSEKWKDKQGQMQERTEWHRVVAFNKLAEICGQWLTKGKQVYIEGKIKTEQWEDQAGNKRYTTKIQADQMIMLGGGDTGRPQQQERPQAQTSYQRPGQYSQTPPNSRQAASQAVQSVFPGAVPQNNHGEPDNDVPF